jgi:transcriptional regulator of acetoin/glycerol metabolism
MAGHPSPWARPARAAGKAFDAFRPIAASLRLSSDHVETIDQSHLRCADLGLSRIESPDLSPLARSELSMLRERNQRLYVRAAPVMEMLFDQIVTTESMVVLCDATGTIIHSLGDDDFLARASKVALEPGVNWSEPAKGTNAIGTALVSELPTLVHADEHFMHANHFLTCSAAPILDPRGNILGVLDVTGDRRSYHQHTMALVKMSARMIENHWLSDDYRHVMRVHFHPRAEFIGTLMEGILAVTAEGRVVGSNRGALDQLGMSGATLRQHTVESLFGTSVSALVDHFRSPLATPCPAQAQDGRRMHLLARFDWPVWHTIAEAAGAAAATATAPAVTPSEPPLPRPAAADEPALLQQLATGDAQMAALIGKLRRVIDRDIPILLQGETGTGKALLARAVHQASRRGSEAFVMVHCASVPADQIEAELFGSEAGNVNHGKIAQAQAGTLFLHDVDELPPAAQARLLGLLQDQRPVIVCTTRRDLRERVAAGAFREDLYYRLDGLALRVPPLRERSDLPALAERIVAREGAALLPGSPRAPRLSPAALELLRASAWPGNVRQLVNVLRSACAMAAGETEIRPEHLPDHFAEPRASTSVAPSVAPEQPFAAATPSRSLGEIEIEVIQRAVDTCGGNISEAAKRLGISRNTIYRRLRWNRSTAHA